MKIYTAKTSYAVTKLTAQLTKEYAKNLDARCYIFSEDKNTLSIESAVADVTGGSFNVNVLSFSRYIASRINNIKALSKTSSVLVTLRLMTENADKLYRIKPDKRPSLATAVYELIAQLKSAKVRPNDLLKICESEGGAFGSKLKDIYTIYSLYEKFLCDEGLSDGNSYFDVLPSLIAKDESLKGAKVIVSGFSSVTKQIIHVFESLDKFCDLDFVLLKGDGEFYTNEIFEKVTELFSAYNVIEDKTQYSPTQLAIEKGLFSTNALKEVGEYSDKVRILQVLTPEKEAETVAKRIHYEVVKNGKRYRDFAIASSKADEMESVYKRVFADYNIPIYVDAKNTMEKHPIVRFITGILDVVRFNYQIEAVVNLSKQLFVADYTESSAFDRYIYKNAISRRTLKKPFDDVTAEKVRVRIINLCAGIKPSAKVADYVDAVKKAVDSVAALEKTDELSGKLNAFGYGDRVGYNRRVMSALNAVFDNICSIIGDGVLSVSEFKSVFLSAAVATEISVVPLYNDMVYMGDFKSVKQRDVKILFAVSMDSSVPDAKQDTALLTDRDLLKMEGYKCIVEPKIKIVNSRERENVGVALMSFTEKLFLLYSLRDSSGQPTAVSEVIPYFKNIFKLTVRAESIADQAGIVDRENDFTGYMSLKAGFKNFATDVSSFRNRKSDLTPRMNAFYSAVKDREGSNEVLQGIVAEREGVKLDGEVMKNLSASAIETYFNCPYSCYLKYNLRLKEDENGEMQALELGNLLHLVLEKFVARIDKCDSAENARIMGGKLFDEIIKDDVYARYLNKSQYSHLFRLIKIEAEKRCAEIYNEVLNSNFKPFEEEVAFGNLPNAKYKAIELKTSKGKKYISGKVDRVDRFNDYIRIIDYKTGNPDKKIAEEKLYTGNSIQLFLYSNAFLDKFKLAGAYYYKVDNSFSSDEGERKTFIGRTVCDKDIAVAMDTRLEAERSSVKYDIKLNSNGTLKENKSMLSENELSRYADYAKKVSASGAEEMCDGFITASPYEGGCEYCKFGGICGYDAEVDQKTRKVDVVTREMITNSDEKGEGEDNG